MFGEVVNKITNWVSTTPKANTFFNKSIPQSIKGTIRSSNNSASGRKKDLIPISILQNVDQENEKIQKRFLTSYCGKELQNPQTKTQIGEVFLKIRTKVEKNSVNYYSKLPGIKYNIKFKDDNCSKSNCNASDDPPFPKKKPESSCKKGTKSQCSKEKVAGKSSKKIDSQSKELIKEYSKAPENLLSKSSCKSSCEASKAKRLLEKKSQPSCYKSSCEESKGKSLLGKKSHSQSSCKENKDNRLLAKKSQSVCRKSTCEKSRDKFHLVKKPQLISHQKKAEAATFKIVGENKPENQCSEPRGPWRFAPSPGSHPVQSKELVAPCSNDHTCLSPKSNHKSAYDESKNICPKQPKSKEKMSVRDRSSFENWKKELDADTTWLFSPGLNSRPVTSKELLKQENILSEPCIKLSINESKECLLMKKQRPSDKMNKLKKKEMYAAFKDKIILPQESDSGRTWIFSPVLSSQTTHPVSSKEYLLKTLKEPPPVKCKSIPSFTNVGVAKSRPICLEKQKSQTVTFDKWKRTVASNESWIFSPGHSSHPVESKDYLSRENVVKTPDVFNFKSSCEPCSKDLTLKLAERSKQLEEEADLQKQPQPLFNFEATCDKFKKPRKEVKMKKKKKERKSKCELKPPKIDLESLVSESALFEGVEPFDNFTTHTSCCCRRPRDEFKLDVKKLRPSTSAVKNQLSKDLRVPKILNDERRTICPTEEEICFEKTSKFQKPKVQKIFPKHKSQSDWKKQKYALQLRIYNCSTKYGDPRPLDPCRPLLKEAGCL